MPGYEQRLSVPAELVPWSVPYPDYDPPVFTDNVVLTKGVEHGWADPEDPSLVDFSQRASYEGDILFDDSGIPLNPLGRTGLAGRGLLGKWGPNHAADPIVFAPDAAGDLHVLLVERSDTGQKAIPGGMVDAGEHVSLTVRRELTEETGVNADDAVFTEVYSGVVEDPRNTDNAWMETKASCTVLDVAVTPTAGDDAVTADWYPVEQALQDGLYANHADFVKQALEQVQASR